jgi:tetratricopeptide (TPR) repeat protein
LSRTGITLALNASLSPATLAVGKTRLLWKMARFLKRFFRNTWSAFLHGKAFKRMECKNYIGAAKILEKLCEDDQEENIEYSYYSLGLCYYALGNYEKALNWCSKSYKLYRQNVTSKTDRKYESFGKLSPPYCYTLKRDGKRELAKVIQAEFEGIR